jgi:hypothetical protein
MAKKSTAVAKAAQNSEIDLFDDQGATGFEFVQKKDLIIPQLKIAQTVNDEVDKKTPKYIEDLEVGEIFDSSSDTIYKDGVKLIPVSFRTNYIEWMPNRSGFVAAHGDNDSILKQCDLVPDQQNPKRKRHILPNGNEIVEHAEWFCINVTENFKQVFLSMAVTQLGPSRKWLNAMKSEVLTKSDGTKFQAPMWFRAWHATTAEASNGKDSWALWKFSPSDTILEIDPSKELLQNAKEFNRMIAEGEVNVDNGQEQNQPETEDAM